MEQPFRNDDDTPSDFTSLLPAGERVILKEADIGKRVLRRKLLLTNSRLLVFEGEGMFGPKYVQTQECPIDQIEEAYPHVSNDECYLRIRTKDGKIWECQFTPLTLLRMGLEASANAALVGQLAITSRWVNAINMLLCR
jgi:hypothetical protein